LRQILVNLVGNAIKFTGAGSVHVTFEAKNVSEKDVRLKFGVIDTGIGISPAQMGLLFQPFSQIDASARRRFGGSGLGLAISQRLARLLGGEIEVSSTPGKGSKFTLTLSVRQDVPTPIAPAPPGNVVQTTDSPACLELNCHVLLVEDGPDNQRLFAFLLKAAGARVTLAENGQVALNAALKIEEASNPIDLILMDMQMPVMDGYEATRRLRNAGWQGPIIALTAQAMCDDRQNCLSAGCDDYLSKPIDRKTLIETIIAWTTKKANDRARGSFSIS
jgi:CheY-like chemotaxis protein